MARLQIVPLPSFTVGAVSQPEYLIVLDQVGDELVTELIARPLTIKEAAGARGILVFEGTIEVVR